MSDEPDFTPPEETAVTEPAAAKVSTAQEQPLIANQPVVAEFENTDNTMNVSQQSQAGATTPVNDTSAVQPQAAPTASHARFDIGQMAFIRTGEPAEPIQTHKRKASPSKHFTPRKISGTTFAQGRSHDTQAYAVPEGERTILRDVNGDFRNFIEDAPKPAQDEVTTSPKPRITSKARGRSESPKSAPIRKQPVIESDDESTSAKTIAKSKKRQTQKENKFMTTRERNLAFQSGSVFAQPEDNDMIIKTEDMEDYVSTENPLSNKDGLSIVQPPPKLAAGRARKFITADSDEDSDEGTFIAQPRTKPNTPKRKLASWKKNKTATPMTPANNPEDDEDEDDSTTTKPGASSRKTKPRKTAVKAAATPSSTTHGKTKRKALNNEDRRFLKTLFENAGAEVPPLPDVHRTRPRDIKADGRSEESAKRVTAQNRPSWPADATITRQQSNDIVSKLGTNLGKENKGDKLSIPANEEGLKAVRKLVGCLLNPNACTEYGEGNQRKQQRGWPTNTHLKTEFPEHFDDRGIRPSSFWNNLTPAQWELIGVPWLFFRPFSLLDNVVDDASELEILLREPGTERAVFTPKVKVEKTDGSATTPSKTNVKAKTIKKPTKVKAKESTTIEPPTTPAPTNDNQLPPSSGNHLRESFNDRTTSDRLARIEGLLHDAELRGMRNDRQWTTFGRRMDNRESRTYLSPTMLNLVARHLEHSRQSYALLSTLSNQVLEVEIATVLNDHLRSLNETQVELDAWVRHNHEPVDEQSDEQSAVVGLEDEDMTEQAQIAQVIASENRHGRAQRNDNAGLGSRWPGRRVPDNQRPEFAQTRSEIEQLRAILAQAQQYGNQRHIRETQRDLDWAGFEEQRDQDTNLASSAQPSTAVVQPHAAPAEAWSAFAWDNEMATQDMTSMNQVHHNHAFLPANSFSFENAEHTHGVLQVMGREPVTLYNVAQGMGQPQPEAQVNEESMGDNVGGTDELEDKD